MSEGAEGAETRRFFRPHTEGTEAQSFLGHRGELALAERTQRGRGEGSEWSEVGGRLTRRARRSRRGCLKARGSAEGGYVQRGKEEETRIGERASSMIKSRKEGEGRLLVLVVDLVKVVGAEVVPFVVGSHVRLDGERNFAFVEESLDEDVAVALFRAVEDELDVASHHEDAVVDPLGVQFVEVVDQRGAVAQFHEAAEWHHDDFVTEAESSAFVVAADNSVGGGDEVAKELDLAEWC